MTGYETVLCPAVVVLAQLRRGGARSGLFRLPRWTWRSAGTGLAQNCACPALRRLEDRPPDRQGSGGSAGFVERRAATGETRLALREQSTREPRSRILQACG